MAEYTLHDLLQRIEEHGGPEGLDLARADLAGLDAGRVVLQAELERARAAQPGVQPVWLAAEPGGLNLAGACLEGADLRGAHLAAATLARADLEDADLRGAALEGADLSEADLESADLAQAQLAGATLTKANMESTNLQQAGMAETRLDGACLEGADLRGANLTGASLQGAELENADLRQACLQGAALQRAELEDADLRGADLSGASLRGADLEDADLRGAKLEGADLTEADLHDARFDDGRRRRGRARHGDWAAIADQIQAEVSEWVSPERMAALADEVRAGVADVVAEWTAAGSEAAQAAGERGTWGIPLDGATALSVSVGMGTIRLVGEARDDVELQCTPEAWQQLEMARAEGAIHIRQREHWGHNGPRRLDLDLAVPQGLERIEVRTGLGAIHGRDVAARVHLATGKGDVHCEASSLEGEVRTGYGDVSLSHVRGKVAIRTGKGDVRVQHAEQVALAISSGRGNVRLEGGELQKLRVHAALGDVYSACTLLPGAYQVNTGAGVITLALAEGQAAQIEANTGMGQVVSDWPLVRVGRPGPVAVGSMRMVGSIGSEEGRAVVTLKTGVGNIRLTRAGEQAQASAQPAAPPPPHAADARLAILESLAQGQITVEEAEELLAHL